MNVELGQLLDSLGWAILHSVWQCMLAAIAVIIFRALTRDNQATLRYSFQLLSLFLCLCAFAFTFSYYQLSPSLAGSVADSGSPFTTITAIFGDKTLTAGNYGADTITSTLTPFTPMLGIFWCLGFAAIAFRYVGAFIITQHLRRSGLSAVPAAWNHTFTTLVLNSGIRRQVSIYISNRVSGPLTLGFFKPIVLVPASFFSGLPADQVEAILLHEIAHIRRHDYLINLFQTVIRTVFFFHPAIYFISRMIDNDREHACDDFAVARTKNPKALARGLVALRLSATPNRFALAADNGNTPLMARLNRLGYGGNSRRRPEHVVTSIGTLALAAALIPAATPFADALPPAPETAKFSPGHPSAKLGNYRFETVSKDGTQFTAKIADDGSRWINVDGAWHDVDTCPEMIAELPAVPVAPPLAITKDQDKLSQYEIDRAYYEARVDLETVKVAELKPQKHVVNDAAYNGVKLDNHMEHLRNKRVAAFIQSHQSRESAQEAQLELAGGISRAKSSVTSASYLPKTVAPWKAPSPVESTRGMPDQKFLQKGIYVDGELIVEPRADAWMTDFVENIVKIETDHALHKISYKEAEKAREKAEKQLEKRVEQAQADQERRERVRDRALENAERQRERAEANRERAQEHRERALEQAAENRERAQEQREHAREQAEEHRERALDQAEHQREMAEEHRERAMEQAERHREMAEAAREKLHAAHRRNYEAFNKAMLKQLKRDGLIRPDANSVTLTYPNKKMTVNGVSVPSHLEDNYCEILEGHNIQKRNNARIEISPDSFSYSSQSGNSSHVIEEEFGPQKEASLSSPSRPVPVPVAAPMNPAPLGHPASTHIPAAAKTWISEAYAKPAISYQYKENLKSIETRSHASVDVQLTWSPVTRETGAGNRNARLSPK